MVHLLTSPYDKVTEGQDSSVIHRLIVRIINQFDHQVHVPYGDKGHHHKEISTLDLNGTRLPEAEVERAEPPKTISEEKMAEWYGKILENVRLRYRKIQRYAR